MGPCPWDPSVIAPQCVMCLGLWKEGHPTLAWGNMEEGVWLVWCQLLNHPDS